jgi:hypothetical protein
MAKAAIELSANALVTIIISIVILVLSIVLVKNMVTGGDTVVGTLDAQTQKQIENMLIDPAARVALPITTRTVSRGETAKFGLGVKNVIGTDQLFSVLVTCVDYIDKGNNPYASCPDITKVPILGEALYLKNEVTIKNTGEHAFPIYIKVDKTAESGTYIFNIWVCYDDSNPSTPYSSDPLQECKNKNVHTVDHYTDSVKKIYVIVK